jgi:hypothetical protein
MSPSQQRPHPQRGQGWRKGGIGFQISADPTGRYHPKNPSGGPPTLAGEKASGSVKSVPGFSPEKTTETKMETELLAVILGTVLPLYPILLAIYQRMGRYDEIVEEFKQLRAEHERQKEAYHGM